MQLGAGPKVAVVGAGVGGLTTATALLWGGGMDVRVYEQASHFARLGAGIQQSPNALKVMRKLGLEPALRARGFMPAAFTHREAATGRISNEVRLGELAERKYGGPYLLLHRGDMHSVLLSAVPAERIVLGKKLVGLDHRQGLIELSFADGSRERADAVIGGDGIHSVVRQSLFGVRQPRFTGRVGYRATFPASRLAGEPLDDNTKWWGTDRHLIVYYVTAARDEIYVMATVSEPEFDLESWSSKGDIGALRRAFADFHPTVQAALECIPEVHKWALADREPLASWSEGSVVLVGDAAHPMMPHMGQGAAMAIEDAAVLARCVASAGPGNWSSAFRQFEASRKDRTADMQRISAGNTFIRTGQEGIDWVFGFDAWESPLKPAPARKETAAS
jgi:6-hydroxynicotinate 3-monooxygenase